jgi:DNA-binding CsgD family transcriptional regulator/PAS domain-containing protein
MASKPGMSEADRVIARAYEALGNEDSWDDVIGAYARSAGADSGVLYLKTGTPPDGAIAASCGQDFSGKWLAQYFYYERLSPFWDFYHQSTVGSLRALGAFAFCPHYRNSEFFFDWVRPQGWGDMIGGHLLRSRHLYCWLGMRRLDQRGQFRPDDIRIARQIAPHFARAVRLKAKIEAAKAMNPATRELIDRLSCAVLVVDITGRPLVLNGAAERLLASNLGVGLHRGRIACEREQDRAQLDEAIFAAARPLSGNRAPATDLTIGRRDARPLTAHVIPLNSAAGWGSLAHSRAVAAIFLIDPDAEAQIGVDVVAAAYGLTPAEARLLRELSSCRGLLDAARKLKVTEATARTHLQRIFSKTDTRNQAELVNLLSRSVLR